MPPRHREWGLGLREAIAMSAHTTTSAAAMRYGRPFGDERLQDEQLDVAPGLSVREVVLIAAGAVAAVAAAVLGVAGLTLLP
jgi:hypothetical protein